MRTHPTSGPESKSRRGSQVLWKVYLDLRKNGHNKEAAEIWAELEQQDAKTHQLEEIAESPHLWQRRFSFKRLGAVHSMDGPEIFEKARLGVQTPEDGARLRSLMSEPAVNYHGFICGSIVAGGVGSAPRWDTVRRAWVVREGCSFSVVAWFQPEDPQCDKHTGKTTAMEKEVVYISGGVERSFVPFQVGLDAYPLRFRSMAERIEVPRSSKGGELRFDVDAKSVLVGGAKAEQRYAIWLECRQYGSPVQNLGLALIVQAGAVKPALGHRTTKPAKPDGRGPDAGRKTGKKSPR